MAQFLQEFKVLDATVQERIRTFIKADTRETETSQLYSPARGARYEDTEARNSQYKVFKDKALFELFQTLVQKLSALDKVYNYTLVPNDVTVIRYEKGGFFKEHSDYLSLRSNIVEEFTMILCLDADPAIEGGGTILHINDNFKHTSRASCTKDGVLLFRKDITHEGELLTSGFKEIATINLWATLKQASALIVSFEGSIETYVIPMSKVNALGDTYFSAMADFQGHGQGQAGQAVLQHKAHCSPEEFRPIYDIYMGAYISLADYERAKTQDLLEEYCIDSKYILMTAPPPMPLQTEKTQQDVFTVPVFKTPTPWTTDTALYLCGRPEEAQKLTELVKTMKLPMIPFKMILVEGTRVFGGGASDSEPEELNMCPVWFSAGELNNIFYTRNICNVKERTLTPFTDDVPNWRTRLVTEVPDLLDFVVSVCYDIEEAETRIEVEAGVTGAGLSIVYLHDDSDNGLSFDFEVMSPDMTQQDIVDTIMTRDEVNEELTLRLAPEVDQASEDTLARSMPWSLDEDGRLFLTPRQGAAFRDFLMADPACFMRDVKEKLNGPLRFTMPQRKETLSESFCNESVYGTMTLLYVEGLVKVA